MGDKDTRTEVIVSTSGCVCVCVCVCVSQHRFDVTTRCTSLVGLFQVDMERSYYFRNSKRTYNGIPVMASNMDTVGTFEMAKVLSRVSCCVV